MLNLLPDNWVQLLYLQKHLNCKLIWLISVANSQCWNSRISQPLRFSVKSILANVESYLDRISKPKFDFTEYMDFQHCATLVWTPKVGNTKIECYFLLELVFWWKICPRKNWVSWYQRFKFKLCGIQWKQETSIVNQLQDNLVLPKILPKRSNSKFDFIIP